MNERFEGIVLFKRPYREHDALVKILTQPFGTKMFFVRGLAKPNHRLTSHLVPMTQHQYIGDVHEEGLSFVKEAQTLAFFPHIQADMMAQAYAAYIVQLVDASVDDNQPDVALYQLLTQALMCINQGIPAEIVTAYMEIHLLPRFGIQLKWDGCVVCNRVNEPFSFSILQQGLLCQEHAHTDAHRLRLSGRCIHLAYVLANTALEKIQSVKVSETTLKEVRILMDEIYQEYVGIRLKSRSYLQQMLNMQAKWTNE